MSVLARPSAGELASARRFRLHDLAGDDRKAIFTPCNERTVIGTHDAADFVVRDASVSRFHCELSLVDGGVRVRDLESRTGTRIEGIPVKDVHLTRPATLELGDVKLRLEWDDDDLRLPLSSRGRFGELAGQSRRMRELYTVLEKAAQSDATVLLQGETGTGKHLAAHALHTESRRRRGPWVVIDCRAIPSELLERDLFGQDHRALKGATRSYAGAFERAQGGTLFLDEIGELSPELQPKLLRALESKRVSRVGARSPSDIDVDVDVRVIAATHRGLLADVNSGRFRADLYYRLAVLPIVLPPLRERLEDLPQLLDELLQVLGVQASPAGARLRTPQSIRRLSEYRWPGNVRELKNHIERCVVMRSEAQVC